MAERRAQSGKPRRGGLYVLSAPSGAGKTTLVRRLVELQPELRFSISYTTRPRRRGESDGRDYFFVDEAEFERMREHGDFLEYASVFGHHYGTGREQVGGLLDAGHDVILEIDWQGARQVRTNLPGAHSIFILPPSLDELEQRLRGRSTDTDEVIRRRLGQAVDDISHWQEFDYVIVNDDLERAVHELREILAGRGEATATDDPAHRQRVARIAAPPV